jgi:hypothetical protein
MKSASGWPAGARHCLRLGSMSDKKVIEDTASSFDVLVIQGNLAVSAPQGLASWSALDKPFWIDPITYAFAADPAYLRPRKRPGQPPPGPGEYKKTFKSLAEAFGEPFTTALSEGRHVGPVDFQDLGLVRESAERIIEWQRTILSPPPEDVKYGLPDSLEPVLLTVPFFPLRHTGPSGEPRALRPNLALLNAATEVADPARLAVAALIEPDLLDDWSSFEPHWRTFVDHVVTSGVKHVWLWISDNDEITMTGVRAVRLLALIESLAEQDLQVHQAFGGSFSSFALSRGLTSVGHGVNYWESKGWQPIASGGLPTARYFHPPLRERLRVPEAIAVVESSVATAEGFHSEVCGCRVCRYVVREDIADFGRYGEVTVKTRRTGSGGTAEFDSPTPEALALTKAHFIEAKGEEIALATSAGFRPAQVLREAAAAHTSDVARTSHLLRWANAFEPRPDDDDDGG